MTHRAASGADLLVVATVQHELRFINLYLETEETVRKITSRIIIFCVETLGFPVWVESGFLRNVIL